MGDMGFVQGAARFHERESDGKATNGYLYLTLGLVEGATLEGACREALSVSRKIGIGVQFKFNLTWVRAWPSGTVEELVDGWRRAIGAAKEKA